MPDNLEKELVDFSKNIKQLREKKGVSQEQMAFDLDIDQSGLSKIERGIRKINKDIYLLIKAYLMK